MSNSRMEIEVIANIKQIVGSLNSLNQRFDEFAAKTGASVEKTSNKINGMAGSFIKIGLVVQQITFYWRMAAGILQKFIVASNEAEQAEAALTQAMINTGHYTKAAVESIKEYAAERQKATIYDDDATVQAAAMLEAMTGLDEKGLRPLIKATQDFASAQKMDLVGAAELMAKTIGSDVNALGRYGIEVKGAANSQERLQTLLDGVNTRFRDQSEALARTDAGKMIQLSNVVGDLRENVGAGIKNALSPMAEIMIKITGGVNQAGQAIQGLLGYTTVLAAGVMALVVKIKYGSQIVQALGLKTAGLSLSIHGVGAALKSMYASLGPVGVAIIALTAVYEVFLAIQNKRVQKTQEEIDKQRELQAELGKIANSYDIGGLQEEVSARQSNNKQIDAEIKKLSSIQGVIVKSSKVRRDEDDLIADARKARIADLEKQKAENNQHIDAINHRIKTLKEAGVLSQKEIDDRKALAELEAKNSGAERQSLSERLNQFGQYKRLTTAQKLEYQQIKARINEIDKADAARLQTLADVRSSVEYLTVVEGKSRAEARKSALQYLNTRIEAAKTAGDAEALLKYGQLKQQIELDEAQDISAKKSLETQKTILNDKLATIKSNDELEIIERKKLQLELDHLNKKVSDDDYAIQMNRLEIARDAAQKKQDIERQAQDDITAIITGGGFSDAYETVLERARQKLIAWTIDTLGISQAWAVAQVGIETWMAKAKDAVQGWLLKKKVARTATEQAADAAKIASNTAVAGSEMTTAGAKTAAANASIPFPLNLIAIGAALVGIIALISSFKGKSSKVIKAAEGALINKPTLALVGEAVTRSGSELILPEKNFRRYMNTEVMPEFRAKLDAAVSSNVNFNTKGLEERLERVESAIYATRNTLTERGIAKAVTRNGRKKLS